MTISLHNAPI